MPTKCSTYCPNENVAEDMKKGIHPQMQWISYVTQSGRLIHVMMTKIHETGKVYHFKARKQMAERVGQRLALVNQMRNYKKHK